MAATLYAERGRLIVVDGKGNQLLFGIVEQSCIRKSPNGNDDIEIIVNDFRLAEVPPTLGPDYEISRYRGSNFLEQARRAGKMMTFAALYGASDAALTSMLQWRESRGPVKNLEIGFLGKFDEVTPRGAHRVNYVFDLGDQW